MRVDTAVYTDSVIPPFYDSLVAKLIVHGADRDEAIQRMKRALSMFIVEGIHTTIPLQERILEDESFVRGDFNTSFLSKLNFKIEEEVLPPAVDHRHSHDGRLANSLHGASAAD